MTNQQAVTVQNALRANGYTSVVLAGTGEDDFRVQVQGSTAGLRQVLERFDVQGMTLSLTGRVITGG